MSDKAEKLSVEQLLQIEAVCDAFEADAQCQRRLPLEDYLTRVAPDLQPRLNRELKELMNEPKTLQAQHQERTFHQVNQPARQEMSFNSPTLRGERFEIHGRLGSGGGGTVWRAYDRQLERWGALKSPHDDSAFDDESFQRETQVVARLQHTGIVRLLDAGRDAFGSFMISELIDGDSLADRMKQTNFSDAEIATLLALVADALAYAHSKGVVHQDLKPQNILLDSTGAPFITDFGLARPWKRSEEPNADRLAVVGTPAYMAPEQVAGDPSRIEPRTDLYALGVVLFQMLTGELPFRGSIDGVLRQIAEDDPPSPRTLRRSVPKELETLCLRCLQKASHKRIASAQLLADELRRFSRHEPILSRPVGPIARTLKWIRRHPVSSALTTTIAILVVTVAVTTSVMSVMMTRGWNREQQLRLRAEQLIEQETIARQQATQALATAQASIERAETEAALSQQSLEFLESVLASADPAAWVLGSQYPSLQSPPTMAELLDTAASRVEKEFANQPLVRIRLMETLAIGYRGIGRFEDAVHLLNRAQQARQELQDSSSETLDLASLKNRFHRGDLHQDVGEYDTAEQLFLDQLRQLDSQTSREAELMRADISFQMGWLLVTRHRSEESKPYFEKTLTLRQRHLPSNSNAVKAARIGLEFGSVQDLGELSIDQLQIFVNGDDRISVLASDYLEMLALRKLQKYDEAQVRYQRVLDELKEMLTDQHPLYLLALGDYAELLWRKGDFNAWPAI